MSDNPDRNYVPFQLNISDLVKGLCVMAGFNPNEVSAIHITPHEMRVSAYNTNDRGELYAHGVHVGDGNRVCLVKRCPHKGEADMTIHHYMVRNHE